MAARNLSSENVTISFANCFPIAMIRRSTVWTYCFVVLALIGIAAIAVHKNGYIAGGDIWPDAFIPGNHALGESLRIWGNGITGFGSPQFAPTEFIMGLWGALWLHFGLSGPLTQFLFLCALLVFEGLGVAYFSLSLFPGRNLTAILAAIALPVSVYNAQIFLNPIQAFAFGYFPAIAGLVIHRLQTPVPAPRFGAELGLACAGFMMLAETPPVAVYAILWIVGWTIASWWAWGNIRRTWVGVLVGFSLGALLNVWWAFAGYTTLFASDGAVGQSFVGPFVWSWVDNQASISNLLSMQGLWLWAYPEYFPWANGYHHGLLLASLYVPVALAVAGIVLTPHKKRAALLTACIIGSLLLAKGYHPPFAAINAWLYNSVPYFWLFRDPQGQANVTLYVCIFLLAAVGVHELLQRAAMVYERKKTRPRSKQLMVAITATMLCGALLLNGFAFVSGAFIPNRWESGTASMVVTVPPYWYDAAEFLNAHVKNARVLLLPNDDFYQMPYKWGYYGIDRVAQTLINADVLTLAPRNFTYLSPSSEFLAVQARLLEQMRSDPHSPILPMLNELSVGWIVQRNDVDWSYPTREILGPRYVEELLSHQRAISKVATFGELDVYRVHAPVNTLAAYDGVGYWRSDASAGSPEVMKADYLLGGYAPWIPGALRVENDTRQAQMFTELAKAELPHPRSLPAGKLLLEPRIAAVYVERLAGPFLRVILVGSRVVGRNSEWRRELSMALPDRYLGGPWVIVIGQSRFSIDSRDLARGRAKMIGSYTLAPYARSVNVELWTSQSGSTPQTVVWGKLGDCYAYDKRTPAQVGLAATIEKTGAVSLYSRDHSACTTLGTNYALRQGDALAVRIAFRHERGLSPRVALLVNNRIVHKVGLPRQPQWRTWGAWYDDLPQGRATLYVYADGSQDRAGTINSYREALMSVFHRTAQTTLMLGEEVMLVPAGRLVIAGQGAHFTNLIHDVTHAGKNWDPPFNAVHPKPLLAHETRLRATVLPDGVLDLRCAVDGIGWGQSVVGVAGQLLHISVRARTIRGSAPLVKVITAGGQVLWQSKAAAQERWQSIESDIAVPPSQDALGIYLYAFARPGMTEVQYRDLRLAAWPPGAADFTWAGGRRPGLLQTAVTQGPASTFVALAPATKLVALNTSFNRDWRVQAGDTVLPWRHVRVDGLYNGWLVSGPEPSRIEIVYGPSRIFLILQILALLSAGVAVAVILIYLTARAKDSVPSVRRL